MVVALKESRVALKDVTYFCHRPRSWWRIRGDPRYFPNQSIGIVFPADDMRYKNGKLEPRLWISPVDQDGKPVDEALIRIGYGIYPDIVRFAERRRLVDMTRLPEIVERVVHSASRLLNHGTRVSNKKSYIYASCKYEIDHAVGREGRSDQRNQEEADADVDPNSLEWDVSIHRRLLAEKLLSQLKGKERDLVLLYSQDHSWEYIGQVLVISPQSAKTQCYRVLRRLRQIARDLNVMPEKKAHKAHAYTKTTRG